MELVLKALPASSNVKVDAIIYVFIDHLVVRANIFNVLGGAQMVIVSGPGLFDANRANGVGTRKSHTEAGRLLLVLGRVRDV
jgi:hypothetical protein